MNISISPERQQELDRRLKLNHPRPFEDVYPQLTREDIEWLNTQLSRRPEGQRYLPFCRATFIDAELQRVDLSQALLQEAHFEGARLQEACLQGAKLQGAHLNHARLQRCDLSCAVLLQAHLPEAHLRKANLREANLRRATLEGADLRGADLRGASLEGAILRHADLRGANLAWAHLGGALYDEDGTSEKLEPADLRQAVCDETTHFAEATLGDGTYGFVSSVDTIWNGANLTAVDWSDLCKQRGVLGEERRAREHYDRKYFSTFR